MHTSGAASVFRSTLLALAGALPTALALAAPPVLTWNGASGDPWNDTATNWLNDSAAAVAWQPGAEARFAGAGGVVNVASDLLVSNLTFAANGYALLGAGTLTLEGALAAAEATTNSIAADLLTAGGIGKTGAGAVALARCAGALAVQAGSLLASGSGFADADLSVSSGAALVTLGDPDAASNLLLNPGFEAPVVSNWGNVGASNWVTVAYPLGVNMKNTSAAGEWADAGASPEGVQMLILQYNAAVTQSVTVPSDGLYSIAFSHILRRGYSENMLYVTLDGIPLASFINRSVQFQPGRFASGALWLKAGSHTLGLAGEGGWDDRTSLIDAVCFAAPSPANLGRALAGDSVLKVVTGASVQLSHSGALTNAYVAINGAAASGTFNAAHGSGVFSGPGALLCAAPANVFTWTGSGLWSEAARWTDGAAPAAGGGQNLLLRFPAAAGGASTNDLSGTFSARRLAFAGAAANQAFALSGNAIALTNDAAGTAPKISFSAPGALTVSAPVTSRSALTLDTAGALTFSGGAVNVASNGTLSKTGPGTAISPTLSNFPASLNVYEGTFKTPALPSTLTVNLLTRTGRAAGLFLTQAQTASNRINLRGSGTSTLATSCGGTVTLTDWTTGFGDSAVFDIPAGDTLSLRQILLTYLSTGNKVSSTTLTKAGAGTLEIRSAGSDSGNNRAYRGSTTLRNGTLKLSEDDWGTLSGWTNPFNGRTYSGTGGSLGYNPFTNAVVIGDAGTAPADSLALIANGNGRWIGHDLEVFNKGGTVTLGMTTGTVMFAGTVTLHRDIVLSGPTNGVMVFSNVVAAADYSGTGAPALSGLAGLRIDGAFPSAASLAMGGRLLSFGTAAVKAQTLNALALGSAAAPGTLNVDFGAGTNDTVAVTMPGGLVLSNTVVNLACAGTGAPFSEPGTYTLFSYAGTLGGDAALLSVGNPQAGASYAFSNDTANARVLLQIANTSGGTSAIWKSATGGDWATGSNWDSGSAPGGAGVSALFGLAITTPATVAIGADRTVGGLAFNNASFGYTLSGGSLTLDNGGPTPAVSLYTGTHTLDTTLNGSAGLSVSAAAGTTLILGSNAVANTGLSLASGTVELRGAAAVNGATALAASTLLRVNATNASVGTLSAQTNAWVSLTGSSAKLTVNQSSDATFAGVLRGDAGALSKSGAAALTLDAPATVYAGRTDISAGALALKATPLAGPVNVGASGALSVQPATSGLMGFYYSVTPNTNTFWTLAGMEAHFATLKPDLAAPSGWAGTSFDFTTTGALFPQPYGAGGSRTINFEAVYRGTITVPESGTYTFGLSGDDGFLLAIDGQTVLGRNAYSGSRLDGKIRLDAGRYDIVLGYFQLTGGYGLQLYVKPPSATAATLVPNAWLAPYSSVGALTGSGAVSLAASNAVLRTTQSGAAPVAFAGPLSGASGSLLAKSGSGLLAFDQGGANAFAGDVDIQAGTLALSANDSLADASSVRVRASAALLLSGAETIGGLSGNGALAVGGYAYAAPFTDDADSGVSAAKTYTHALDFPSGTADAVVNGVTFYSSAMSGSRSGYGWSVTAGTAPTGSMNQSPYDSSMSGVTSLLWDFCYGSYDFTMTLTGLTPNKAYELRFYFRNWAGNQRDLVFTFSTGAGAVATVNHNPDSVARSIVACRYTADSAGTVVVRVVSTHTGDSCHLYALSNEELPNTGAPALTLAPAAGRTARFTGCISGYGSLAKNGAGTQSFGGANALATPLSVLGGTAVLTPGATLPAGATVAAGATLKAPLGSVTLGTLTGGGTFELTGAADYSTATNGPRFVKITGDADSGLSPDKLYTHLVDFGSNTNLATVNGVTFNKETAVTGPAFGYSWVNAPATTPHAGGNTGNIGVPSSQGIFNLINDFCYGGPYGPTAMTLTGLTTGKWYEVRFYHRKWGADQARNTTMTFDPDGPGPVSDAISFNPDSPAGAANYNDNYLAYRYLAQTNQLAITITCPNADRYHLYGLSNEEVPSSLDGSTVLTITNSCVFAGAVAGRGPLVKSGAGTLTLTGVSTATGAVTVSAGAYGVAAGGRAPYGPVAVAAGATLFGDGQVGGNVSVASNGWLMAGTAAACGTLQIGGSLALAPGARLAYRFGPADSNDTVTVGGLLTFPTNGVVLASALAGGVTPPAKDVFLTSPLAIAGPADLTGWTVEGVDNCSLVYSADRKTIFLTSPRGTMILLR